MKSFLISFALLLVMLSAEAQTSLVSGYVLDAKTDEVLIGTNIAIEGSSTGTSTNSDGYFELNVSEGSPIMRFSSIGYQTRKIVLNIQEGDSIKLRVRLKPDVRELGMMVVSASRYEKQLERETASVDILPAELISNTNARDLDDALLKVPGVYIFDGQMNMRGGTGYAYGAGSRVMMVIDDQPLLSADRNDIKWNFVPIENIEQVEVIKGASSVMYGSSALNGVVHVRTAWPGEVPQTKIQLYQGYYNDPKREITKWWDSSPVFVGGYFSHKQKFGDFDLVLGGRLSTDQSYLENEFRENARFNWKTRYRPPSKDGMLSYGLNGNIMYYNEGLFLVWNDADSGALIPLTDSDDKNSYLYTILDPYIKFRDKKGNHHSITGRYYNITSWFSSTNHAQANLISSAYQFHREFNFGTNVSAGINDSWFFIDDNDLFDHTGNIFAMYFQADHDFGRLNATAGLRWEYYNLDTAAGLSVPVIRAGLNYKAGKRNYLRASFGQGYRFPSIAERYVDTDIGGSINILPNPDLKPEIGWNAEIGTKQVITGTEWKGYIDLAGFWTEYNDMTEFVFDLYPEGLGFKSVNIGHARIAGIELSASGQGKIGQIPLSIMAGYTYVYPADLNTDTTLSQPGKYLSYFWQSLNPNNEEVLGPLLRYRFRHIARINLESGAGRWTFGFDLNYYSFMEKIDAVFELAIDGIKEFRELHPNGDFIADARVGYLLTEQSKISFYGKNLMNSEYSLRPGRMEAPRNFSVQYRLQF